MPAILSVHNLGGREADYGSGKDKRLRRSWLIKVDSRLYSEAKLLEDAVTGFGLPIPFASVHPDDIQFLCKRLRGKQQKESPLHWIADADYDTVPMDGEDEEDQPPTDRRAKITWSTIKYQKAVEKDIDDKGIVNSAGMPFNPPPLKDLSRWTCTVTKNVAVVPTSVLDFPNKLNSGTFSIGGVSVPAKVARITAIQIGDLQKEGDNEYYAFSYTLEFDPVDKWKGKYLQQGLLQKSGSDRIACVDKHGSPVRTPVPLDSSGVQIANPTTANAAYTDYDIYETMDFSGLPTS